MKLTRERLPLVHRLVDESGHLVATLDLSKLEVSPVIAAALLRAHDAEYGHTAIETQKQAFRCIRKLILCLQQSKIAFQLPLPSSIASMFHDWLEASHLVGSTAQSHQNIVFTVLRWCRRNAPEVISDNSYIGGHGFARNEPEKRNGVDEDSVKLILARCYDEIEKIEARFEFGRRLVEGNYAESEENNLLSRTLIDLLRIGKGRIPNQHVIVNSKLSLSRRVAACGGLQYVRSLVYLTTGDVFPFYMAVVTQTGGNPMAIRLLELNCIEPHPLRSDLEFLCWDKKRAKSEQRQDYPVGKKWSAPNIIRRLLKLNETLRMDARPSVKKQVFLARGLRRDEPEVPSVQSLHNYLAAFVDKYEIQDFDFEDMRTTVARVLHRDSHDIEIPKRRLNHKNVKTTSRYTSIEEFPLQWHDKIAEFQGILIGQGGVEDVSKRNGGYEGIVKKTAETVFGFGCRDPFAGADGVTPKGTRCTNFTGCSTCIGSVIPLDDPRVISRILAAKVALEAARQDALVHGWSSRFEAVYGDTLSIINTTILSSVSPVVMEKARKHMNVSIIPVLE